MSSAISIREEQPVDFSPIRDITVEAFSSSEFGHNGEAELIEELRQNCQHYRSFVACRNEKVIGHVLFTHTTVQFGQQKMEGMGLAPMSVAPEHQKMGVGSALVNEGLKQLFSDDCQFVIVLGHPDYYPRFGFRPGAELGVSHGFAGIPQEVFFIIFNPAHEPSEIENAQAYYHATFGPQHEKLS